VEEEESDPEKAQIKSAIKDFLKSADLSKLTIKSVTKVLKNKLGKKLVKQHKKVGSHPSRHLVSLFLIDHVVCQCHACYVS
jgi:hypothetical protein